MRRFVMIGACLASLLGLKAGWAEEILWRPAGSDPRSQASSSVPSVTLRPAQPISGQENSGQWSVASGQKTPEDSSSLATDHSPLTTDSCLGFPNMIVRGQVYDSRPGPPPPTPSPFGGPAPGPPPPMGTGGGSAPGFGSREGDYNCGVDNIGKPGTGWDRFCDGFKHCCEEIKGSIGGAFQQGAGRQMFQSDHDPGFEVFSSPVTNPFLFMDPRSLTEVKPIFIWQGTRSSNPVYAGGSNFFLGLQGSLALTEHISFKISELGLIWSNPDNPGHNPQFGHAVGISELHLGPQITFYRNPQTKTLIAAGLTFELPVGPDRVFQDTGGVGFVPYLSFGQNFLGSSYGSFNFLNTTGWSGGVERSGFFFSSFHLDYNIQNLNRFYPMVEINWQAYTNSGTVRTLGFEGTDLFNFGSRHVAGQNDMTLNLGGRVKLTDRWQVGGALGFGVLSGGQHMDGVRLMLDMIFRY